MDEAFCTDANGSNRFVDILAYKQNASKAFIIDPTIRFETNEDMDTLVAAEKKSIYEPCVPDIRRRYPNLANREFAVIGLWMGARGTVGRSLVDFFKEFELPLSYLPELAEKTLSDSIRMVHSHVYQ